MKSDFIRARVEPKLKANVHRVFESMGLTPTQVITMLYKYIERERKIPFSLSIPNEKTAKAIREAKAGKGLIESGSLDELFDKLEIE
ncbi:MAG: type II toxin-antitoxin system RelB/DinJ family antitoxin [Gammaproteobacteria bacterium]|jgi:DNA-damage-inducible protein J